MLSLLRRPAVCGKRCGRSAAERATTMVRVGGMSSSTAKLKTYSLSAVSASPSKPGCLVQTATGHRIATDLPSLAGGADEAPQPVELMLAALLGCKTATAHYVARNLWPRPHHRIHSIAFEDVIAERDERGALTLPVDSDPPVTAALLRVRGVARVRPASDVVTEADVEQLGALVEHRCPVAATLTAAGCKLDFEWVLEPRVLDPRVLEPSSSG